MADTVFPPGFRFLPTDVELIKDYLYKKIFGLPLQCPRLIADVDVFDCDPDDLPGLASYFADNGSLYFFARREPRHPNSTKRPRRSRAGVGGAGADGTWSAKGKNTEIKISGISIGNKTFLTYFVGETKTKWRMCEYKLDENIMADTAAAENTRKGKGKFVDLVLCRVFVKKDGL